MCRRRLRNRRISFVSILLFIYRTNHYGASEKFDKLNEFIAFLLQLFVYLFAPICHHLKESDFQNVRHENGLKIWQAMWEFRHPDSACFTTHVKQKPKYLSGKLHNRNKPQFGDVFIGRKCL